MQYWFNISSGQVETDETRSQDADVLGPYATREDATAALAHARARSDSWDDDDRAWNIAGTGATGRTGEWSGEALED